MEHWNDALFLALNAPASPDPAVVAVATAVARDLVYVGAAIAVSLWIWGSVRKRGALLATGMGLLVSLAISLSITLLWYHPRPFVVGIGHTLMAHSPETSFPSDHATFLWTMGLGLIVTRARRAWGLAFVVMGFVTAWARIYLGVHFPFDMAGSFAVAAVGAAVAHLSHSFLERRALPSLDRLYERTLTACRLPPGIFPRQGDTWPDPKRSVDPATEVAPR